MEGWASRSALLEGLDWRRGRVAKDTSAPAPTLPGRSPTHAEGFRGRGRESPLMPAVQPLFRPDDIRDREVSAHTEKIMQFLRRFDLPPPSRPHPATADNGAALGQFAWLLHREPGQSTPVLAGSIAPDLEDDQALVERVIAAYRLAYKRHKPSASGWDQDLVEIKKDIHNVLLAGNIEQAGRLLRNQAETALFWGFDAIAKAPPGSVEPHEAVIRTLNPS